MQIVNLNLKELHSKLDAARDELENLVQYSDRTLLNIAMEIAKETNLEELPSVVAVADDEVTIIVHDGENSSNPLVVKVNKYNKVLSLIRNNKHTDHNEVTRIKTDIVILEGEIEKMNFIKSLITGHNNVILHWFPSDK